MGAQHVVDDHVHGCGSELPPGEHGNRAGVLDQVTARMIVSGAEHHDPCFWRARLDSGRACNSTLTIEGDAHKGQPGPGLLDTLQCVLAGIGLLDEGGGAVRSSTAANLCPVARIAIDDQDDWPAARYTRHAPG